MKGKIKLEEELYFKEFFKNILALITQGVNRLSNRL